MQESGGRKRRTFHGVVEGDPETGLLVGSVPGWPGAHGRAATMEDLEQNLREVLEMLLEEGEPDLESEFVGLQTLRVAGPPGRGKSPSCSSD